MIGIDCGCGHHLEASTVERLFALVRQHADEKHQDLRLSDQQIREMIAAKSYTA
ncbi:MAG TPA: hypothetical protein VFJ82_14075 [Longimicrobium sp.]|nr:hypothetical protein [Longimicrobium sp.]